MYIRRLEQSLAPTAYFCQSEREMHPQFAQKNWDFSDLTSILVMDPGSPLAFSSCLTGNLNPLLTEARGEMSLETGDLLGEQERLKHIWNVV